MKSPWATEVPPPNKVRTFKVPGVIAWMMAAPVIPPRIWLKLRRQARNGVNAPTRAMPSETAGLKRPPETRKKIQALTVRLKPNESAMYSKFDVLAVAAAVPS